MTFRAHFFTGAFLAFSLITGTPAQAAGPYPWSDPSLSPDSRAGLVMNAMTDDEKATLVFGQFGSVQKEPAFYPAKEARMGSAGYVPGIPRLGIPPQWITDAGLGVATQRDSADPYRERTALPAGMATAASWNPGIARQGGAMIGREAVQSGFNVLLGGGINLIREPRGGRNFEYASEDPLLSGIMVGAAISGIQSNNIISTIKHYAINSQEAGRNIASANIAEDQARMSDLLAFEIAIEQGKPGSVMCSYNRINTVYACENDFLLTKVLKTDWAYPGYVMSDWGAVHSTEASALAGLDQESAYTFDAKPYFGNLLKQAVAEGRVPKSRLDDMARRIVRSMFANGLVDHPVVEAPIDYAAGTAVAQKAEEEAIVLLKNSNGALPLAREAKRVVVIGGHADRGVISGGGSSTVFPVGINAVPGLGPQGWPGPIVYLPSSPLEAIKTRLPNATVEYLDGQDAKVAAAKAAGADIAIVFATQWSTEDADRALSLADEQNDLIAAVAKANRHTVVVLETSGAVFMPWLDQVAAVMEAWFPGSGGGEAIARVLFGEVDASGRLPVSFPANLAQLPHPEMFGSDVPAGTSFDMDYSEGAAVGYKWHDKTGQKPLFAFGHGLSYTQFAYSGLSAKPGTNGVEISFTVTNTGSRPGKAVPQIYIGPGDSGVGARWEAPRRLAGWSKVELEPGTSTTVTLRIDSRLVSVFDLASNGWRILPGKYEVWLGASAADLRSSVTVHLDEAVYQQVVTR